jgi:hypothetical protein
MKTMPACSFVTLALLALNSVAHATTIIWTNTAGGDWSVAANWSPNQVPGSSDSALITNNGTYTLTMENLTVGNVTLGGGSGQQILDWNSGSLAAGSVLTVASSATLSLEGSSYLDGVVTNAGTVIWPSDAYYLFLGAPFYNLAGALFNGQNGDYGIENDGSGVFNNAGIFEQSVTSGTCPINVPFTNTGTLEVQSGTVSLNVAGSSGGSFTVAGGATLVFNSGYTLTGGGQVTGSGSVQINGNFLLNGAINAGSLSLQYGMFTNNGTLGALSISNLVVNDETLAGTTAWVVTGTWSWNSGSLAAGSVLTVPASETLSLGGASYLDGVVTNAGTVIWPSDAYYLFLGAPFYNLAGALFNGQNGDYGIENDGSGVFNNAGIFEQSVTSGTCPINVPFTNTGTLEVQSGTVSLNSSYDLTNGTLNFDINSATNFGQITLSGDPALLAGKISATLNSNYLPPVNTAFQVLNYFSYSGGFTNTNLPPVAVWQTSYNPADVTIEVLKWVPQLTWTNPANIVYGTRLSGAQLDATAASPTNLTGTLAGTLTYAPPIGTALYASNNQTLSVTFTPADQVNYTNVTTSVTINVLKAPLTVTAKSTSKTYGQTVTFAGTEFTTAGLQYTDAVTGVTLTSSGASPTAAVAGSPYPILPSLAVGSGLANYTIDYVNGSLTVNPAPVTITSGIAANNKVYDRTTTATLSSNTVVLTGVITGDTATLNTNGYAAHFASAGVGNGIAVTVTGLTLSGASAANYALTQPSLTANITAAPVTISSGLTANNKVYDRTTTATLSSNTVVLTGVITGDTATLNTNGYAANFAGAGVGNGIAVTVTGLTLTGASASNYALTQPSSLTANITAAPVTISSGLTANNKVYDRTTTATLSSNTVVLTGVITGDTAILNTNGYAANFAGAGVGNGIAVTVTGLTLTGASAANYALTQPSSLTANITAAPVTISSGLTANNKVYDRTTTATLSSNSVVLAGVITGDTATLNTNGYAANFAGAGVGNGIAVTVTGLTLTGASAANYALTQPSSLTANITAAPVTISSGLTANNKVYDRTTTATLSSNTVVLTGVITGDTATLNTNGYAAHFASAGVGNGVAVTVTGLTLTGASASNYALTQPSSLTANITAAPVTISSGLTANNKVYDRTTTATLSSNSVVLAGVITGDTATLNTNGYAANFASAGVGNGIAVTVTGLTLTGASAANYTLTQPSSLTANITAPSLQIMTNLPNVVLSWPTNAVVFVLNGSASLNPPIPWTPVTSGITVIGSNNTFTTNASSGNRFYVLIAP